MGLSWAILFLIIRVHFGIGSKPREEREVQEAVDARFSLRFFKSDQIEVAPIEVAPRRCFPWSNLVLTLHVTEIVTSVDNL